MGPGQSLSCPHSTTAGPAPEYNSGTLVHWICAGVPVKTTSERHQSHVPACPWLKGNQEQCQHGITWDSQSTWAHPRWTSPEEQSLVASLPVGVLQSYLPWPQIRIPVKKRILGLFSTNQGADPTPDRAVTTTEPRGSSPQYPGEAHVTITAIKAQIKGIRVQACGPTSPPRGKTTELEELGSWSLQNRPQTQKMWQNERTKKYDVEEGARQKATRTTKWRRDRQSNDYSSN